MESELGRVIRAAVAKMREDYINRDPSYCGCIYCDPDVYPPWMRSYYGVPSLSDRTDP